MECNVLTLFPDVVDTYLTTSLIGKARELGLLNIALHDIRAYATDPHHSVDDTPYGGGAGMVMKIEPIDHALAALSPLPPGATSRTIVLSARGRLFTQRLAEEYAAFDRLTFICGRYEGIDQRVADHLANEELSIGPYVLAGGELAALVVIEAVARLVPGVLGNPASLLEESYVTSPTNYSLPTTNSKEYPHYTKPETYRGWQVPAVLLSGNHAEIQKWREAQRGLTQTES